MGEREQRFSSACSIPEKQLLKWATFCGSCMHPDQSYLLALGHNEKTISEPEYPSLFYTFSCLVVYPYMTVLFGSILTIGVTYFSHRMNYDSEQKAEKRKLTREKCQEIFELFIQVYRWLDNENSRWWERIDEHMELYPPVSDTLECPIDKLSMLIILYTPQLEKQALELNTIVQSVESNEWDYRNDCVPPTMGDVADFLREQSKNHKDFRERFTSEMKKFVANI